MTDSTKQLTAEQWQQTGKQALEQIANRPLELRNQRGRTHDGEISVRSLIWGLAKEIIALHDQGITYETIALHLTQSNISISGATLRGYLSDYRKQKGTQASQELSREELLKNLKF